MRDCLARMGLSQEVKVQIILSTGCEGVIAPGGYVVAKRDAGATRFPGLAMGVARSEALAASEMICVDHARIAAEVTRTAVKNAGLATDDVALVLMKSPVLTNGRSDGTPEGSHRTFSPTLARAVAGLGVGMALNEIATSDVDDDVIGRRFDLHARRAMIFSGTETRRCEAIVLGNRPDAAPALRSGLVHDLIDIDSMAAIIAPGELRPLEAARRMARDGRIVAAFFQSRGGERRLAPRPSHDDRLQ